MKTPLQIFLICFAFAFLCILVYYLVRKKLNLKYTLVWLITVTLLLVLSIFPSLIIVVSKLLDIADPVNGIFLLAILFILIIVLTLTAIVSHMNNKVYRLAQKQALLEKRIRELETKTSDK